MNLVEPDPCRLATVTASGQINPSDHEYSGTTSLTATYKVSDPTCSLEYVCIPVAGTDLCAIGTIDASSKVLVFELSTTDKITYPPGTYQVDIVGQVSGYPTQSVTHTFTYNFIDLESDEHE